MEHEHYTYPEALRYLAKKYNIEIEEKEQTPEMLQEQSERESLYIVSTFAEQFFVDYLHHSEEGKSIGLTYFKERGFSEQTIQKFRLGYSPDEWEALTKAAIDKGYKLEFLEKTGLAKRRKGDGETGRQEDNDNPQHYYDGFRGRVMFPIHNLSGRVIGFGGRVLKKDEKTAKYINTPECDIYHKSKTLYGIYFAKKSIIENDNCYLVEGYTDVISLHQSGIENSVASSGTSLTQEQIRLIGRYTKNITILYDGDAAGIKASFRGIDMILEEGMNVKAALFPDGEDPDSFSKKVSSSELAKFIAENLQSFVEFKTNILIKDVKDDPFKRTEVLKEMANTIALLPALDASSFTTKCCQLLKVDEKTFLNEVNKARRNRILKKSNLNISEEINSIITPEPANHQQEVIIGIDSPGHQEQDIIRILLRHGDKKITIENYDEENNPVEVEISIADYIIHELVEKDKLSFETPVLKEIFNEFISAYEKEMELSAQHFINHNDEKIKNMAIELVSARYELHNWSSKNIRVATEEQNPKRMVNTAIISFKEKKIAQLIEENRKQMKDACDAGTDFQQFLHQQKILDDLKRQLAKEPGRVIIK